VTPALLTALVLALGNDPYCRSRVDTGLARDPSASCLWWDQPVVVFHSNDRGNPETTGDTEFEAARRSIQEWHSAAAACSHLAVQEGPRVQDRLVGIESTGGTERNIIVYRDRACADVAPASHACWQEETCMNTHDCWYGSQGTIALTTTTYETRTGRIFDADVELNAAWFVFTTVDGPPCVKPNYHQGCVATDVENTLTHELGHALGLDHTTANGSTMNATAPGGETSKRQLDSGSRQFMCDVYPAGGLPRNCVVPAVHPQNTLGDRTGCLGGGLFGALALGVGLGFGGRRRRSG
jgi:hypothetical protein